MRSFIAATILFFGVVTHAADRNLTKEFLTKSGNMALAGKVVYYESLTIVEVLNNILNVAGVPTNDPSFWNGFAGESVRITTPHLQNVQNKLTDYFQKNLTDEELKTLNLIFSTGAGKKYAELYARAEFLAFYQDNAVAMSLYKSALNYAQTKKGMKGPLRVTFDDSKK